MSKLVKEGGELGSKLVRYGRETASALLRHGRTRTGEVFRNVLIRSEPKVHSATKYIDETLGVTEVREAQQLVCIKEDEFLKARGDVRAAESLVERKQNALNETRAKLDRTDRLDEKYLAHVAEEHNLLLDVKRLQSEYRLAEDRERQKFTEFSSAVRSSHEKERARVERTKYWSLIGSISGTILGFFFSSLLSQHRLKEIKSVTVSAVEEANSPVYQDLEKCLSDAKEIAEQLHVLVNHSRSTPESSENAVRGFVISDDSTRLHAPSEHQATPHDLVQMQESINSKLDAIIASLSADTAEEASIEQVALSEAIHDSVAFFKERDTEVVRTLAEMKSNMAALYNVLVEKDRRVSDRDFLLTKEDSLDSIASKAHVVTKGAGLDFNGDCAIPDSDPQPIASGSPAEGPGQSTPLVEVVDPSEPSSVKQWSRSDQLAFLISAASLFVLAYAFRQ